MGLPQISASYLHQKKQTVFSRFPIVGIQSNYSADSLTTDSAAAATAFACGVKTNNRMIGMDPMGNPAVSILTFAENMQKKTGVIVCSSLVHATPAAFFSHNPSRYNYEDLALDFSTSGVDYFVGGGKKFFDRRTTDNRNLYQEMVNNGYYINDYFQSDFSEIDLSDKAAFGFFTADDSPLTFDQGRDYMYAAIQSGIEFLDSDKGFFLLVEGSQIDWGGHARNINYVLSEMGEFETLVGEVLDFAETDGETLVIVTGDHETGGLTINFDSSPDSLSTSFSSKHHSAVMIPVFAYGPGDKYFSGLYENTAIFDKMKQAFGFETSKK
jgi:alkaline phosphatase